LNKLLPLLAFSILLLLPVSQNVFANHPDLPCLPPGVLNTNDGIISDLLQPQSFCYTMVAGIGNCPAGYFIDSLSSGLDPGFSLESICTALPSDSPDPTHPDQCQGASVLLNNHCFAQALSNIIGGVLLDINTVSLLVGAIGTNPIITGLVGITIAGIAGQTAWFVHRRRVKKVE